MTTPPVPRRLSDAERDEAVDALRQHFEDGRLTDDEVEQRTSAALGARTTDDAAVLFTDLPEPHPYYLQGTSVGWSTYPAAASALTPEPGSPADRAAQAPAVRRVSPTPVEQSNLLAGLAAAVWPVAILLMIFGHTGFWPIIVAIVLSSVLGGMRHNQRRQPPPY